MAGGIGFSFEVGGPSSGSVTDFRKVTFRNYREDPAILWSTSVVWTSLGPLPRWVPGPTTRWALGTTRLALHGT
jgi:hypothetical protein